MGILIIAERVPELDDFLREFLTEDITSIQILHSLRNSIRNFVGKHRGSKSKRKRPTAPPKEGSQLWRATFDERYQTLLWEHSVVTPADSTPNQEQTSSTLRSAGEEQVKNIQCVATLVATLLACQCNACPVVKSLLASSKPAWRAVMPKMGTRSTLDSAEKCEAVRQIWEQEEMPNEERLPEQQKTD